MEKNLYINFLTTLREKSKGHNNLLESIESGYKTLFEAAKEIKDFQLVPMGYTSTLPKNWSNTGFEHSVYGVGYSEKDAFDRAIVELKNSMQSGFDFSNIIEYAYKRGLKDSDKKTVDVPFMYGIRFNL
jgi:hypothetical protein